MQCASRKWSSRLCVLINPILPCAIHRDHAGEMPENTSLAARNNPQKQYLGHFLAYQESNLWDNTSSKRIEMRQLTNRRMRTFIATPSARNENSTEDPP
jgi:hypothetical protein